MAVSTTLVEQRYTDVEANDVLSFNGTAKSENDIKLRYGNAYMDAIPGTDYTVAFVSETDGFTAVTVKASLIAKINQLISLYPDSETNVVFIRRQTPNTSDITPTDANVRTRIVEGFDRAVLRTQEIAELAGRAVTFPYGEAGFRLPEISARAGKIMAFDNVGSPYMVDKPKDGATGPQGPEGPQGPQGIQGPEGPQGPQGVQGVKGDTGATGAEGPQGATGAQGPAGGGVTIKGTVATSGSLPASGNTNGDAYVVSGTGHLWVWGGSWTDVGAFQGPAGPTGPQGSAGPQGIQGIQGPQGVQGVKGDTGNTGAVGPGVPTGGTTGQIVTKKSGTNYDTEWKGIVDTFVLTLCGEASAPDVGVGKASFRAPFAYKDLRFRASAAVAQTSGNRIQINVRKAGVVISSTPLSLDNGEKTSVDSSVPYVLTSWSCADDEEYSFDVAQVGDGTARGLKVTFIAERS